MNWNRRDFLRTAGLAPLTRAASAQDKRPNVLFLFTDDQRFNTIRALNNPEVKTPNLDRLAARGTAFTRAHIMGGTIGAVCAPSRAMLLTGQSLFHIHDSIIEPKKAAPGRVRPFHLFPEEFAKAGYTTFGTGKWHNGPPLFARCFRKGGPVMFGGMSNHLKVPVQDFDPTGQYPASRTRIGEEFSSELFSDAAIDFLKNHKGDNPFLAYVAYTSPHDPRMAPKKYADMYPPDRVSVPENFLPEHPFDNGEMRVRDEMLAPFPRTPQAIREHLAAYYAMITEVDAQIGRVLDALEATGKADNTVIVFAADNGLAVGQHGLMGKQNMYEHSVRVPLILSGPGVPKGQKRDALCYLYDLFPTLCGLTGVNCPATVEGKSLKPVLANPKTQVRDSVFYAYRHIQRGVRKGDWKLIAYHVNGVKTRQLFDLASDPLEKRDLAADPKHAAKARELTALLKEWMARTDDPQTDFL